MYLYINYIVHKYSAEKVILNDRENKVVENDRGITSIGMENVWKKLS